jgi:hypothetical protein
MTSESRVFYLAEKTSITQYIDAVDDDMLKYSLNESESSEKRM